MSVRERVARGWHAGSDHAADGTPFGGPLCNCWQVAGRIIPMLADAWAEGQAAGINDDIGDWEHPPTITTNPYESEEAVMSISHQRNESRRWTQGHPDGPRFDADGIAWFACDPYPTWYRWDDGRLVRGAPWFPKAKGGRHVDQ